MCFVVIVGSANVNKLNKKCLEYTYVCWCYNVNCILLIDIIVAVNRIHIHVHAVFAAIFVGCNYYNTLHLVDISI